MPKREKKERLSLSSDGVVAALRKSTIFNAEDERSPCVLLEEVSNSTGFKANRRADVLAVSLWPSRGIWFAGGERFNPLAHDIMEQALGFRGQIVGSIEVVGYMAPEEENGSAWRAHGSMAIMMRDPKPLKKYVPANGALGWWTVQPETLGQLREVA